MYILIGRKFKAKILKLKELLIWRVRSYVNNMRPLLDIKKKIHGDLGQKLHKIFTTS